jgi:alkylated DNA repair dioxygenase AlkB
VASVANVRSTPGPALPRQPTLFSAAGASVAFDPSFASARRIALDEHAWIEYVGGWVQAADALFEEIVERAPWQHKTVHMYDRMVDEPRLTAWYGQAPGEAGGPAILAEMATALSARYDRAFDGIGAALYRDGRDSVAWHRDRIDPVLVEPVVAIVSLGSARTLRMRSCQRGGPTRAFPLLPGDLFVMGGSTQRTWEHSVPKVAAAGARLSLQFRHSA